MAIIELLTADLRLALLLVGAFLLIGIVVWEVVQRRRASKADAAHQSGPPAVDPLLAENTAVEEPSLTLPEMHVRDRLIEPTLVDLDAAISKEPTVSIPVLDSVTLSDPIEAAPSVGVAAASPSVEPEVALAAEHERQSAPGRQSTLEPESSPNQPVAMRLDWPPPDQQRIIGVRVIARNGERFTGVSLRQALLGEGFQHGELEIFHRPMADGRVLLSAASLTKPGNFDLATMDSGLFLGLNLFAVLPGPLPGRDTVDKLLIAGHTLAQRLRGELRDARGEPLTEARLTEMRREAAAGNG